MKNKLRYFNNFENIKHASMATEFTNTNLKEILSKMISKGVCMTTPEMRQPN